MRVTAGEFRGRVLQAPKGGAVRPTADRTRQAVFNILLSSGLAFTDITALDVFCGTGALGIESLSRGAAHCTFIDSAKPSLDCARANIAMLKAQPRASFILRDAAKIGSRPETIPAANLAFLDPPYRKDLIAPALRALADGNWLADGALLVVETESKAGDDFSGLSYALHDSRSYGETLIRFLIRR